MTTQTPQYQTTVPPEPFPMDMFPPQIEKFGLVVSESVGCNFDFIAVSMIVATSIAIGNKSKLQIKKGWQEGAIVYALLIGEPGAKKTPAISKALSPLFQLQSHYLNILKEWEKDKVGERPETHMIIITDSTMESIASELEKNPHGLLLHKDEAISWIKSMNLYRGGKGDDMEKFLSVWSQQPIVITRKSSPTIVLERPFIVVLGGIQPEVLADLAAMKANGFVARLNFSYPDSLPAMHSDAEIPDEVMDEYSRIIRDIYEQQQTSEPLTVFFSPEAAKLWKEWHIKFCHELNNDQNPSYLKETLAKLEAYTARYALILEYLWRASEGKKVEQVSASSLQRAIKLTDYFKSHAQKVFHSFISTPLDKQVEKAVQWFRKQPHGIAKLRKFYSNRVAGVKNATEALDLFGEMRSRGLGTLQQDGTDISNGRPTYYFQLSPKEMNPNPNKNG